MWFFFLIGAAFLVLGRGAYAGWNRRWLSRPLIYAGYLGPAMVPIGAGLILMGLSTPVADLFAAGGPSTASGIAWSVGFFGGLTLVVVGHFMGTSGMPARWRPRWVRALEGLAPRPGGPVPVPGDVAPSWSTVAISTELAPVPTGYAPPLGPIPQRSVQAVVNAAWGGARSLQKDPAQLELLQRLNLLDGRLHPTPAGSLMAARLYWESAATLVIEASPPGRRSVVVTIVDHDIAVLEFRQDWGRSAEPGAGLGGFDVLPYRSEEQIGDLLRPWVTAV
ncbi:hypothetical protein [Citricoccus sp. K5]|uniref:hypothetical protein n=1 Tax=Citricoccus sp. K5 TaxID=2653135 RepID=UPI0013585424|nr:hypothetical protein [Citricoccus sp. K5]